MILNVMSVLFPAARGSGRMSTPVRRTPPPTVKRIKTDGCSYFERSGYVRDIPGCVFISCRSDAATFFELKPTSPICGHFKHPRFATMFLGEIYILPQIFYENKISVPYLLNYFVSFLIWYRRENYEIKTFIFPFLNIYAIFGLY